MREILCKLFWSYVIKIYAKFIKILIKFLVDWENFAKFWEMKRIQENAVLIFGVLKENFGSTNFHSVRGTYSLPLVWRRGSLSAHNIKSKICIHNFASKSS